MLQRFIGLLAILLTLTGITQINAKSPYQEPHINYLQIKAGVFNNEVSITQYLYQTSTLVYTIEQSGWIGFKSEDDNMLAYLGSLNSNKTEFTYSRSVHAAQGDWINLKVDITTNNMVILIFDYAATGNNIVTAIDDGKKVLSIDWTPNPSDGGNSDNCSNQIGMQINQVMLPTLNMFTSGDYMLPIFNQNGNVVVTSKHSFMTTFGEWSKTPPMLITKEVGSSSKKGSGYSAEFDVRRQDGIFIETYGDCS